MTDHTKKKPASTKAGQTPSDNAPAFQSSIIIAQPGGEKPPDPPPIPTEAGGPTYWAATDGIFTLAQVLLDTGIVRPSVALDSAIYEAYQLMGQATYHDERSVDSWGCAPA